MNLVNFPSRHMLLRIAVVAIFSVLALATAVIVLERVNPRRYVRQVRYSLPFLKPMPSVKWETASPGALGVDSAALASLRDDLAGKQTKSLLVAKDGKLIYEWYASDELINSTVSTAALAKSLVGSVLVGALMTDGYMNADDRLSAYARNWHGDDQRSQITIRHLMTHTSGIENVEFREGLTGWQKAYFDAEDRRFLIALKDIPLLFPPGSRYEYSGTAFYALAYAAASSLKDAPISDVREYLASRIIEPLGISESAWKLSYGESYQQDDMELYAIGSGASFTPRAMAKLGQLVLQGGAWDGRQLIDPVLSRQLISYDGATPPPDMLTGNPAPGLGWWTNNEGIWRGVPRDTAVGLGRGHQVILVIPSLNLVAVRTGGSLGETAEYGLSGETWHDLEQHFLNPLMEAISHSSR